MKLNHSLTPYTKINSKWIRGLNKTPKIIKILEENIGNKYSDIGGSNVFLDSSPEAREVKAKINYWDYIKKKKKASAQHRNNQQN